MRAISLAILLAIALVPAPLGAAADLPEPTFGGCLDDESEADGCTCVTFNKHGHPEIDWGRCTDLT